MAKVIGIYLRFLYNIKRHLWFDIPQSTWILALLAALSPWPVLGVLPGGVPLALFFLSLILVLVLSQWWGQRVFYVHFVPDGAEPASGQEPLWPQDKVLIHATGRFTVEGKEGVFTGLLAYYRTFETREHAIMARDTPTRFLAGLSSTETLGMWYIFIEPQHLQRVTSGWLYHGASPRPALRLDYIRHNKKGKALPVYAYLRFDSQEDQRRVQADLLLDLGGPAASPWRPPQEERAERA